MAEISIIGSAWIEEAINCTETSMHSGNNPSTMTRFFSGDMYNVAYTLAMLETPISFCMKYGNDFESAKLWSRLNDLNIMLYGPTVNEKLPTLVTVTSNQKSLRFWDGNEAFNFLLDDLYPHAAFASSEYVVTDIQDNAILESLIMKSPNTKWVTSRFVPNKNIISCLEGIILTYEDALALGKPSDFDRICYRLCSFGVKWVVIYMGKQGVYTYTFRKPTNIQSLYHKEGYESGCYSGFLAGLLFGLVHHYDLINAASFGNKVSAAIYNVVESTRDDIQEAIKGYEDVDVYVN